MLQELKNFQGTMIVFKGLSMKRRYAFLNGRIHQNVNVSIYLVQLALSEKMVQSFCEQKRVLFKLKFCQHRSLPNLEMNY